MCENCEASPIHDVEDLIALVMSCRCLGCRETADGVRDERKDYSRSCSCAACFATWPTAPELDAGRPVE